MLEETKGLSLCLHQGGRDGGVGRGPRRQRRVGVGVKRERRSCAPDSYSAPATLIVAALSPQTRMGSTVTAHAALPCQKAAAVHLLAQPAGLQRHTAAYWSGRRLFRLTQNRHRLFKSMTAASRRPGGRAVVVAAFSPSIILRPS